MYTYDRRVFAALQPTVEGFLAILKANLIQSDAAQMKRDRERGHPGNPYALSLQFEALKEVKTNVKDILKSSEPEALEALKRAILRKFNNASPVNKTLKAIDKFLKDGKPPKYPTGVAQPIWK